MSAEPTEPGKGRSNDADEWLAYYDAVGSPGWGVCVLAAEIATLRAKREIDGIEWAAKWSDGGHCPSKPARSEDFAQQHARMFGTRPMRREVGPWLYADTGERVYDLTRDELPAATGGATIDASILSELRAVRQRYVENQVTRQLDHREGDMTRAQIDDAEIAAKMRWDEHHPALARAIRHGIARSPFPLVHEPDAPVAAAVCRADGEETRRG